MPRSTMLDRLATAIDMFFDVRRATSIWTRGFTGEGPATIQRSRRHLNALDLAGIAPTGEDDVMVSALPHGSRRDLDALLTRAR
jgi:hypothetical protein